MAKFYQGLRLSQGKHLITSYEEESFSLIGKIYHNKRPDRTHNPVLSLLLATTTVVQAATVIKRTL